MYSFIGIHIAKEFHKKNKYDTNIKKEEIILYNNNKDFVLPLLLYNLNNLFI